MALEDCTRSVVDEIWESKKVFFNIKLIPSHWYSEKGLVMFNENQELSIQIIQNEDKLLQTRTF
ncbi:8010_t:CDS:2 [Scutellospora calospora]|uniref:8010_t:CDS:1 n=1 Tax=Scutellospora calospora TaxID=85575 RepID=A0ACA9KQ11_9GLOM|nr:8010_t:CDS:2 [Scutellospora calospora]